MEVKDFDKAIASCHKAVEVRDCKPYFIVLS